ncbi:hypothetical protein [Kineosporia sp. NBRC 101731]|uniref:hypothetical protein n=1 Tax=Kineosporia sp. NBRC 101731 TaxID=3032199 RepID=UPI0024A24B1B|nr:hypothetical protein [Kineosporia sp. NBRC 101731]GLY28563.1 hypothetical protein Kisp02_19280 [Kineosporia sp. NBRC 101731]
MGKKWHSHAVHHVAERCPVHSKNIYPSSAVAGIAAKNVERKEGLESGAMDTFYCEESKGWHIGHRSIRARIERKWSI